MKLFAKLRKSIQLCYPAISNLRNSNATTKSTRIMLSRHVENSYNELNFTAWTGGLVNINSYDLSLIAGFYKMRKIVIYWTLYICFLKVELNRRTANQPWRCTFYQSSPYFSKQKFCGLNWYVLASSRFGWSSLTKLCCDDYCTGITGFRLFEISRSKRHRQV